MANKFWGLSLEPEGKHVFLHSGTLHLTQASLSSTDVKPGKTYLKLRTTAGEYVICTLSQDSIQQQKLDVSFSEEMEDCMLTVSGTNTISVTGQVLDDDDEDFQLDEDDEDEEESNGMLQFRDPSDNRFLGGFELRHFGLGSPPLMPTYDNINLRKEEKTPEDKRLHDNIVQGLINSMLNSGDPNQLKAAKRISKKLKKQKDSKKIVKRK